MVRPKAFGFNVETAGTNVFQRAPEGAETEAVQRKAIEEFDAYTAALASAGVRVIVVEDTVEPPSPDAVFPCNWVTFHSDGTVIRYPMHSPARRRERRQDVIGDLERMGVFRASRVVDLSAHESEFRYLEGSGSLVFDDVHGVVYACRSPRTDIGLGGHVAVLLGYELVAFSAVDAAGVPIYHTDIVLALGGAFAVVADDTIADGRERARILDRLRSTGRALVSIGLEQAAGFAGNILELTDRRGAPVITMSSRARAAFDPAQLEVLRSCGRIVDCSLSTIESVGGGSARCMIADVPAPVSASGKNRGTGEPGAGEE